VLTLNHHSPPDALTREIGQLNDDGTEIPRAGTHIYLDL